jgi:hypothetical protein
MLTSIKTKLKQYIERTVDKKIEQTLPILYQLVDFRSSPQEDRQPYYERTRNPTELRKRFINCGIPVEEIDVNIEDFENWLTKFPEIRKHYSDSEDVTIEKCLEHYLTYKHLNVTEDDVFIDIAASGSPWANILSNLGVKSYRLDITYPKGIHGINIGADAADTKLPNNFASILALHCAFECFMGDADLLFIREANRILRNGGRLGIVPLYCDDTYLVLTSPYCDQRLVSIEPGAKRVWRDDKHKEPFSRHYSPEVFAKRIYSELGNNVKGKLLYIGNIDELVERYKGQRIYCNFMFYWQKL